MSIDKVNNGHEKNWFSDQYEKLIGKPLPRKELTTEEVLKRLQDSTKYRWIPEAKAFQSSSPENGSVHYIEWKGSPVKKCTCPDSDCRCKGDVMFPPKKIPRGGRYFKNALCRKLLWRFKKPAREPPRENFIQRLADVLAVEEDVYKDLDRRGVLSIRGAEFCFSRCIRFYGPDAICNLKNIEAKQQRDEKVKTVSKNSVQIKDDNQIRHGVASTVSNHSNVTLKDEAEIDNISEEPIETPDEAILRDIDGRELHISNVTESSDHKSQTFRSFNKFINIPGLTMCKLKNQIISLKRNIYSSVLEIQEKYPTSNTNPNQNGEE